MNHKVHEDHKDHEDREGHKDHEDHKMHGSRAEHVPLTREEERVVHEVIGAALAVHRALGPGFIEPVYERAICVEIRCKNLRFERQGSIEVVYRGEVLCSQRLDLVVENLVVVEVKAVKELRPIHQAQLLSYLKASGYRVGLLMNFNVRMLVEGLQRFVR